MRSDKGELFGNFTHSHLLHLSEARPEKEIDFIVKSTDKLIALETKYSGDKSVSFAAFSRAYPEAVCKVACFRNPNPVRQEIYSWQAGGLL